MSSTWNFTLNDTSPVFTYSPYSDGPVANGWQIWYSSSGFNGTEVAHTGHGSTTHFTSLSGASVTLQFYGVGIELYGTTNSSFQVTLDGSQNSGTASGSSLFSQSGLTPGAHNVTLSALPSDTNQMLGIQYATIVIPSSNDQTSPSITTFANTDTDVLSYQGSWQTRYDQSVPNGTYHSTSSTGASVAMQFMGEAVEVVGVTNYLCMNYTVTLDGNETPTMNQSSYSFVPETTMFFQSGLDPTKVHTLNMTQTTVETSSNSYLLVFDYITIFGYQALPDSSGPSSPDPSPHGPNVAGPIAGAIVGVLVISFGVIAFVWWRRRRPVKVRPQSKAEVTMDMESARSGDAPLLVIAPTGRRENTKFSGNGLSASGGDFARTDSVTPSARYAAAMNDFGFERAGPPEGTAIASSGVVPRQDPPSSGIEKPPSPHFPSLARPQGSPDPQISTGHRALPPPPGALPSPPPSGRHQ